MPVWSECRPFLSDSNIPSQTRQKFLLAFQQLHSKNSRLSFLLNLRYRGTRGCFVAAELNRYSRQAVCLTPTLSKQSLQPVTEPSVHRPVASAAPSVLHAEIPPLLWKQWGWNALSETVNIVAALKLAYVVYVSSSLVYLLSSAGCVSWNVQRCSCRSAGGCWL